MQPCSKWLQVGDTQGIVFLDDALLTLIGTHGSRLRDLCCSGCIDITDAGAVSYAKAVQVGSSSGRSSNSM